MQKIILGKKLGMTQIWDDKGRLVAGTVIIAEPNTIIKNVDRKHIAVATRGKTNKAQQGMADKVGSKRGVWIKEVPTLETDQEQITVEQFEVGDKVKVSGITKGKGFAGNIKRHKHHRGPVSHGSDNVRGHGSIGAQEPQRVPKGQSMPGRMGGANYTVRNGKILIVDKEKNILVVSGNVPGPARGKVVVENQ